MRIKITKLKKCSIAVFILVFSASAIAQENAGQFKVITYNIWNGYDWGKDEIRRAEVAEWINNQEPSIVALQELCRYSPEKLAEDAGSWGHDYSVLLKTTGYSVGLTSRYPIEVREKILEGLHHGALHCVVKGVDVFVIHFHPGSISFRRKEVATILDKVASVREHNRYYMVLGDFNSHSPFDADLYDPEGYLMTRLNERHPDKGIEEGNLSYGDLDYSVMSSLLAFPLIDVCRTYTCGIEDRGSFPGRILGSVNNESDEELVSRLERIDYILVSPELSLKCTGAGVCNGNENYYLSDHYPVLAEFKLINN
jgi:endonuclease/exonuclease/phosphatase family metal-dependent hydrolase